jgi:hypothetical protein
VLHNRPGLGPDRGCRVLRIGDRQAAAEGRAAPVMRWAARDGVVRGIPAGGQLPGSWLTFVKPAGICGANVVATACWVRRIQV